MKLTDRIGAILVIAAKPRIQSSVRSALTAKYGRVLTAETVQEARRAVEREKIALMVIFSPLKDEEEIPRLFDMAERRGIAAGYIVGREIYGETAYRLEGRNVFVVAYPLQMDQVLQLVSFLHQVQKRFWLVLSEQERLQRQVQDIQIVCRVKCLLVEKREMTEEEAHHFIEQEAMNTGLSKREAALKILKELQQEE
ncbi:MAG: ANTAR domain-containing protein [Stomatobaculum sp.]|nr:ANTAR domain-containing protein [Stomatobaculum sp.]MBR7058022.1 ANTAR domain-containing protein [Stomatobaculum sp.]